jgi:excisionase family DNA binding protein
MSTPAVLAALEAFVREVARAEAEKVLAGQGSARWVSDEASPLPKKLFRRLVREGALPGRKAGRRLLVRQADLDAYLAAHPVAPRAKAIKPANDTKTEVDKTLEAIGFTRKVGT